MARSPIDRQPTILDYASPTQFKFTILQLPKVEFFTTSANVPSLALGDALFPTPFTDIPIAGDKITFDSFTIGFIVDEYLENFITLQNWMRGLGFPSSRSQFSSFRDTQSIENLGNPSRPTAPTDRVGAARADRNLYADATITILSNKNNPIIEVRFTDMFPVSLSGLDYTQDATDTNYLTCSASFRYTKYEIISISSGVESTET